jgi:hypothetical protein
VAKFEDAIQWMMAGAAARRACWASVPEYTRATPPMARKRQWRVWMSGDSGSIMQGWGGQIGMQLDAGDPIRDGTYYSATDDDRTAADWEMLEKVSQ